ncbi:hypothetical protein [Nocardioides sediminis]|uniref:hypothetical protein n=1 Tax=Nocardioides sediminis TaxID=433648 RepID=UPI00131EEE00|nr:hypothetical protein [Nocardioides sediminis]
MVIEMYNNGAAGGGSLAVTGMGASIWFDALWMFLAGFALIAATMAVGRIVPRRHG